MDWTRVLLSRCAALFRTRELDADLDEELSAHLVHAIEENRRNGMSQDAARTAALRAFGGMTQTREAHRRQRGLPWMETLAQDLRFAVRQLLGSPGFATTAILTLTLGIGANTVMVSVVRGVLLAPLPYSEPDQLVIVWQSRPNMNHVDVSYPDFRDWQRDSHAFAGIAAVNWAHFDITAPGSPENVAGMRVSSGFFATLGVKPALGREISPAEDMPHAAPVAMISDRLWRSRFDASPDVLGRSLRIEGIDTTVVGVLPPSFRFFEKSDVFVSIAREAPQILLERSVHGIAAIGRLKRGLTLTQAQDELAAAQQNLDRLYPDADRSIGVELGPLKQEMVGDVRPTLLLLLGAVALVLLIACANIANLLLARSAARVREFGIRAALGAGRMRIVRQLLTESLLLSLAGGLCGLFFARIALRILLIALRDQLPRSENIAVDLPVIAFTLLVMIAAGAVCGLAPALRSARVDLQDSLRTGGRGATGERNRAQSALVVAQMALTLVLLAGAGLLLRSITDLLHVNPGFASKQLIAFRVGLSPALTRTAQETRIAFQQMLDRIRHIPGVEAADLTNILPLNGDDNSGPFWLGISAPPSPQDAPHALYFWTGPDYLATMKIPLLRGRFFSPSDTAETGRVIVIDNELAQRFFPGVNPIGQTVTVAHWGAAQVVGVVGHVRHWGLADSTTYNPGQIYIPIYQLPDGMVLDFFRNSLTIVIRTPLSPTAVMPAVRSAASAGAADQTIYNVQPFEEILSASMSAQRLPMVILGAFAALALLLASVGIYGVISYSVAKRVQEIGIRMALGASRRKIVRLVTESGMRLAVAGIAIGAVAALALARLFTSFSALLYGVKASDPLTMVAVSLLLMLAAITACAVPALRAMRVDPIGALRTE